MKGYRVKRNCYNGHWAWSFSETLYYFPQHFPAEDVLIFISSKGDKTSAGIGSNPNILNDVKNYCEKCLKGEIPKNNNSTKIYEYNKIDSEFSDFTPVDLPINFDTIKEIKRKKEEIDAAEKTAKDLNYLFLKSLKNDYGISS